jgi:hypothetical protein
MPRTFFTTPLFFGAIGRFVEQRMNFPATNGRKMNEKRAADWLPV